MSNYNLAQKFYINALEEPDRTALVIGEAQYSYGDLAVNAAILADRLLKEFPWPAARVGILASRTIDAYVGILASAWAGITFVPLNTDFPKTYLSKLVKRAKINALIVDWSTEHLLDRQAPGLENISFISPGTMADINGGKRGKAHTLLEKVAAPVEVSPDDLLYITFTSGSTGEPKMIGASAANVSHFLIASQARYKLVCEDRLSQFNDLCWDPSIFDMFAAWAVGAAVHVVPAAQLLAPAHFIRERCLTVWYSTPSQIEMMSRMNLLKPGCFPLLRLSLFVGEPLTDNAARQWSVAAPNSLIENVFGPTETTVVCMGQPFEPDRPEIITPKRGYVAIGKPYPGIQVAVINRNYQFLDAGEEGELVISGPTVAPGYLDNPELTAQKFVKLRHPQQGESIWYLTGDRGYQDRFSGIFHFLGRADNQVQLLGKRVELEEVEFHLRQVSGSEEAVVVGWPIRDGSVESLVAFVSGIKGDSAQLRGKLLNRLPAYMVPRKINVVEEMPRNRNGKIDRKYIYGLLQGSK